MKLGITGVRGLVGSRIAELLRKNYEILGISSNELDIRDKFSIRSFLNDKNLDILIHLAAKADVDACEAEKDLGEESEAWKLNVTGAKNIAKFCRENKIKLIFISTDFVFDGEKKKEILTWKMISQIL